MNIIKKLEFDEFCKKNTVVIALLAAVLLLSHLVWRTAGLAPAELTGALAACGMLTLYLDMAAHAFRKAVLPDHAAKTADNILLFSDMAAEILKLIYILTPFTENDLPLRLAVLVTDAALSRIYRLVSVKKAQAGK